MRAQCFAMWALSAVVGTAGTAMATGTLDIGIAATADNEYGLFLGDGASASEMIAWVENYSAGGAGISDAESYARWNVPSGSYLYAVASSDYAVLQGLLVDVTSTTPGWRLLSGDPRWEVTATGLGSRWGSPVSLPELTDQILLANAGANVSGGWVAVAASTRTNGEGGIIDWDTGDTRGVIPGIDSNSRWMWYDSGGDSRVGAPFLGYDHNEWLIFRTQIPPVPAPGALVLAGIGIGSVRWLRRCRTL